MMEAKFKTHMSSKDAARRKRLRKRHFEDRKKEQAQWQKQRSQLLQKLRKPTTHKSMPDWFKTRKVVKVNISKEMGDCNKVCPLCSTYIFVPCPPNIEDIDVEFLPCSHAVHASCKASWTNANKPDPVFCPICLKPMDRNDMMWTGVIENSMVAAAAIVKDINR